MDFQASGPDLFGESDDEDCLSAVDCPREKRGKGGGEVDVNSQSIIPASISLETGSSANSVAAKPLMWTKLPPSGSSSSISVHPLSSESTDIFSDSQKSSILKAFESLPLPPIALSFGSTVSQLPTPTSSSPLRTRRMSSDEDLMDLISTPSSNSSQDKSSVNSDSEVSSMDEFEDSARESSSKSTSSPKSPLIGRKRKWMQMPLSKYMKIKKRIKLQKKEIEKLESEIYPLVMTKTANDEENEAFKESVSIKADILKSFFGNPISTRSNDRLPPKNQNDEDSEGVETKRIPNKHECECLCFCSVNDESDENEKWKHQNRQISPEKTIADWLANLDKLENKRFESDPSNGDRFDRQTYSHSEGNSSRREKYVDEFQNSMGILVTPSELPQTVSLEVVADVSDEIQVAPTASLANIDALAIMFDQDPPDTNFQEEMTAQGLIETSDEGLITLSDLIMNIDSAMGCPANPEVVIMSDIAQSQHEVPSESQMIIVKVEPPWDGETETSNHANRAITAESSDESQSSEHSQSMLLDSVPPCLPNEAEGNSSGSGSSSNTSSSRHRLSQLSVHIEVSQASSPGLTSFEVVKQPESSVSFLMPDNELGVLFDSPDPNLKDDSDSQSTNYSPRFCSQNVCFSQ